MGSLKANELEPSVSRMGARRWRVSLMLLLTFGAGLVFAESAPLLLNYQGRLTNSVGTPVTATTSVRFTLIQGGTATEPTTSGTVVYQEDEDITPDSTGVFVHVIGSGTAAGGEVLEETDFITNGPPLFVEMSIAAEPLLPRTQILSTGYAIEASRLDGKSAAEIIGQSGGNAFANEVVRNGAKLEYVTVSQIRVRPGTLGFPDAKVRNNGTELTWDFANGVGLLGLDAGSEAAATWYYAYAVPDGGDDNLFTVVASIVGPPAGPTGFAIWKYLGAFRNDSGSNIKRFYMLDRARVQYASRQNQEYFPGPTAVTQGPDFQDLSGFVPATASAVVLIEMHHGQDADWYAYVDDGGAPVTPSIAWNRSGSGSTQMWSDGGEFLIPMPDTPKGYWREWRVARWRHVYVTGWVDGYLD